MPISLFCITKNAVALLQKIISTIILKISEVIIGLNNIFFRISSSTSNELFLTIISHNFLFCALTLFTS